MIIFRIFSLVPDGLSKYILELNLRSALDQLVRILLLGSDHEQTNKITHQINKEANKQINKEQTNKRTNEKEKKMNK